MSLPSKTISTVLARVIHARVDSAAADQARASLLNIVNNFFYQKMTAMPEVRDYMESMSD